MAKEKGYWTEEKVIAEIRRVMDVLGINHLPTRNQIVEFAGIWDYSLNKFGGLKGISEKTGIPMHPKPKTYNKGGKLPGQGREKWNGRPSRASEIEAKARKSGLHYADLQKAETLRLAGRIGT